MVDEDLQRLVIEGNPTDFELNKAWNEIRADYAEKMGDHEYRLYLSMFKEIHTLELKIDMVKELVNVLRRGQVQSLCDRLNDILCTDYKFNILYLEQYDHFLDICYNRTGGWKIRMDMLLANFENIKKKNVGNNRKPTREYYLEVLISLSDHAHYPLSDSITVAEFCLRMTRATKANEALKNAYGRR